MRRSLVTLLAAAALIAGLSPEAAAHRNPLPLALWGGYGSAPARCQRVIGYAATRCGTRVWAARNACLGMQVAGATCDEAATDAAIQDVHQSALNLVDGSCADYAGELGFALTLEAETDIDTFCQQLDTALMSGIYGPVLTGTTARQVGAGQCVGATASAAIRLLRFAFRSRTRALDRIASGDLAPTEKEEIIARSDARIARGRATLGQALRRRCPDELFVSLYGRSVDTVLTLVAERADCLGGASYVQDAVVCPPAVCGNGMIEPGEQCDDGNTLSGDGCNPMCKSEMTPALRDRD